MSAPIDFLREGSQPKRSRRAAILEALRQAAPYAYLEDDDGDEVLVDGRVSLEKLSEALNLPALEVVVKAAKAYLRWPADGVDVDNKPKAVLRAALAKLEEKPLVP